MPFASEDRLPFAEANEFFRQKIRLPSASYTDIWRDQHDKAFVIAGARNTAMLEEMYSAIQVARDEGRGIYEFRERFPEIAQKYGWSYNGAPGWRSRVIYETNITQARRAGELAQRMELRDVRPYWVYRHSPYSVEPRKEHLGWDGLTLRWDDPWWQTHNPQNGWGCDCYVDSKSKGDLEREGKSPDSAPQIEYEERVVGGKASSTRRTVQVPKGIDPGFDYQPGARWLEDVTVPPLDGWGKVPGAGVLDDFSKRLAVPNAVPFDAARVLSNTMRPEQMAEAFLGNFGATLDKGAMFVDKTGTPLAISAALFKKGVGKDKFKWLDDPSKLGRLKYANALADTLIDPQEVWWFWERDAGDSNRWRLKRRYLKVFDVGGKVRHMIAVFEWGNNGWTGASTFAASKAKDFRKWRQGRLIAGSNRDKGD